MSVFSGGNGGIYHLIDDITVNGKTFSKAADNGNGDNTFAGPERATRSIPSS